MEWIPAPSAIFARSMRPLRSKVSCQLRDIASLRAMFGFLLVSVQLDLRGAAIYEEVGPGHVTALVRREENHRARDFLDCPDATERRAGGYAFFDLFNLCVAQAAILVAWGDDRAGADYVDADSSPFQIHRPGPRERAECRFGRRIDAECRHPLD